MKTLNDDAMDDAMNPGPDETKKKPRPETARDEDKRKPQESEDELDEAIEETFPASDPVSPSRIDGPTSAE